MTAGSRASARSCASPRQPGCWRASRSEACAPRSLFERHDLDPVRALAGRLMAGTAFHAHARLHADNNGLLLSLATALTTRTALTATAAGTNRAATARGRRVHLSAASGRASTAAACGV